MIHAPAYINEDESLAIIQGDCLDVMSDMADRGLLMDAVITDPPYASGGLHSGDRRQSPRRKYQMTSSDKFYPDFGNDARDMRSHYLWSLRWMELAYHVTRPGGFLLVFSDWRQNALTTDALQVAGWTYRACLVWDKTEGSRPTRGFYRAQAEFIHVATRGALPPDESRPEVYAPGVFRHPIKHSEKCHLTGKPVALMRNLMSVLPRGSRVLDPFAGSCSTLAAADSLGLSALGVEMSPEYVEISRRRLTPDLFPDRFQTVTADDALTRFSIPY